MSSAVVGVTGDESGLVARLSLEEKVRLLTGANSWVLHGEPAIGLRPIVMSDGPAGVRGIRFDATNPSTSLPCPVALGATWDPELIEELSTALGREARAKGVDVVLGPTINIVRTPLSGRGFECFSEDPLLTSRIAVAYVRGLQKAGVGATAKHYVANDSETERRTYDARISEDVLRELYLAPFEACVAEAGVFLIMAAYNSVNGATMTANAPLVRGVLKGEWEFTGAVVSDWSATTSTIASAVGGLDLVMPGPEGPWGEKLVEAVRGGTVAESDINDKVARLLTLGRRLGALNGFVDGTEQASPVSLVAPQAALIDPALVREVAARSFVLLKNDRRVLPIAPGSARRVALIGPNAVAPLIQGGGSIQVLPVARPGITEALADAIDAEVTVNQGALTSATVAIPPAGTLHDPVSGKPGVRLELRDADGTVLYDDHHATSVLTWWDGLPGDPHLYASEIVMRTRYRAQVDGRHVIGAAGVGEIRIAVGDTVVAEARSLQPRDVVEALSQPPELRVPVEMRAGRDLDVRVEFRPEARFVTMRLGIAPQSDDAALIQEAVAAATAADVAVVIIGSAEGSESEGFDRPGMSLVGSQDELVRRVAAANPSTVVVLNTGMPVVMPWIDDVAAVVQAWLPGQAFGEALADVLSGAAEPGGRLPISIPRTEADAPVYRAQPDNGTLAYSEGLLVGYRGYDRKGTDPLFAFGHGLGYTEWQFDSLSAPADAVRAGDDVDVTVALRNMGTRDGREVVQVYLEAPGGDPRRPVRTLAGFARVSAEPGETVEAAVRLRARAFARFDESARTWVTPPGTYTVRAGRSSRDLSVQAKLVLR